MKRFRLIIIALTAIMIFVSCEKDPAINIQKIELTKDTITVKPKSVTIIGTISYPGKIDSVVVCYADNEYLFNLEKKCSMMSGKNFTTEITGLEPATTYHYYYSVYYGMKNPQDLDVRTFTTTGGLPVVVTSSVNGITATSAICGGNVTDQGASNVTERGICWSIHDDPTLKDSLMAAGTTGIGSFTCNVTGLTANTTYHVRAYATNSQDTSYGSDSTFTTSQGISAPTVTTDTITYITQTTATGGGNVTSDGGATVTERGVCWSLNENPTTADSHVPSGSGTGGFTANMTDLTANTTYHVRAYAINSQDTSYGSDLTFTTSQSISAPTVTTDTIKYITQTTATGVGNVTSDGGATVTERGVCWSTSHNPTIDGSHAESGSGLGEFTVQMDGLSANTTYYVRAYAVNEAKEGYGEEVSFTTKVDLPTVTTSEISNITQTTATGGGNVTSGINVSERGVCWSTSENPTTNDSHTYDGTGTGSFTSSITGLSANTTYYVRAFATNNADTAYGSQVSFTTKSGGGGGGGTGDHEYVDLGLPSGLLWATCNVGADSPEDYGNYYAWGETTSKSTYNWSTYQWCNGSQTTLTKYCTNSGYGYNGFVDNKTVLEMSDDAARANWGGDWRMPTRDEMVELKNNCTWTWTTQNGKNGYRVTGPNGNSIFLPAAGYYSESSLHNARSYGYYWSSSLITVSPYSAYYLYFSSSIPDMYGYYRSYGHSVRPVCPSQK